MPHEESPKELSPKEKAELLNNITIAIGALGTYTDNPKELHGEDRSLSVTALASLVEKYQERLEPKIDLLEDSETVRDFKDTLDKARKILIEIRRN